jgi:hypothetical protein
VLLAENNRGTPESLGTAHRKSAGQEKTYDMEVDIGGFAKRQGNWHRATNRVQKATEAWVLRT